MCPIRSEAVGHFPQRIYPSGDLPPPCGGKPHVPIGRRGSGYSPPPFLFGVSLLPRFRGSASLPEPCHWRAFRNELTRNRASFWSEARLKRTSRRPHARLWDDKDTCTRCGVGGEVHGLATREERAEEGDQGRRGRRGKAQEHQRRSATVTRRSGAGQRRHRRRKLACARGS